MSSSGTAPQRVADTGDKSKARPGVSILIPAYGAADKLRVCLDSLRLHAPADCTIHVLDDATPDASVEIVCKELSQSLPQLEYVQSRVNRGFVGNCNWGNQERRMSGSDLLLLNSDTQVTAGFLEEMQDVLYLHEKHAVVTPRSNNATIFSIPWTVRGAYEPLSPADSYDLWNRIRPLLPRYQVMPTAVGFCMLIRGEVLERFELFDEAYSPGYNEENDFICRINRYGYSAVAANWAYVFHCESSSFGPNRAALEASHSSLLAQRYPEYERKLRHYAEFRVDPVEIFAVLHASPRPRILYDVYHLPAAHTGTSDFGLGLLRELRRVLEGDFDFFVGLHQPEKFFDHELAGYRIYKDHPERQQVFDLVFKPCQLFSWHEFHRMNRLAPRVSFTMQDIIGVRCAYLNSPEREFLFKKTAELSDCVFTISEFSRADFTAYYGSDIAMHVIYHGTHLGATASEFRRGEYVLVMGNSFVHKGVLDALRYIGENLPVVLLGGGTKGNCSTGNSFNNGRWVTSGNLSRQEMRELLVKANAIVYPSHYEGFGLPVVDALALGKPAIVLESEVNEELARLTGNPNLHRIRSLKELQPTLERVLREEALPCEREPRSWRAAAEEYASAFRELLASDVDVAKLRTRWDALRLLKSVEQAAKPVPEERGR